MIISAYAANAPDLESVNYTLALVALIGVPLAIWRSKGVKQIIAAAVAILGRPEVTDRRGRVLDAGQPGLIHVQRENSERLTKVEEAVIEFRHMSGLLTETLGRIDAIDTRVKALEDTGVRDIVQAAERAATAAVSAEMLRLVHERDTVSGDATEPSGELGN